MARAAMCGGRRRASRCWCSRPVRRERPPVWPGQACGQDWNLAAGEVLIYSGSASIRIGGGGIRLTGDVLVNGKPVLTGEG